LIAALVREEGTQDHEGLSGVTGIDQLLGFGDAQIDVSRIVEGGTLAGTHASAASNSAGESLGIEGSKAGSIRVQEHTGRHLEARCNPLKGFEGWPGLALLDGADVAFRIIISGQVLLS
jgi:hypothetical protein